MFEKLLNEKITYWENQLLDLGKRNKMIAYRETKRATLKILTPDFDELYQRIAVNEEELTFQRAVDRDFDPRMYSALSLLDALETPLDVRIGDIRAEGTIPEIRKTLQNLRSKARLSLDEQGTNILYLVFGFLEWREEKSGSLIKSPLILAPVSLLLRSLNAPYALRRYDDEIVANPTLSYLFQEKYAWELPEFDAGKDTPTTWIKKIEKIADGKGWRIFRECSLGLVSFTKISMYQDLAQHQERLKAHPILRAFAGERGEVSVPSDLSGELSHDNRPSFSEYQVLQADSSQMDAIALSRRGVSFVMQGPPGTGKSQTIANIIASGLADGKKILFVSQKMAALDVVYKRLSEAHLDAFCLPLHSHKANKKEIVDELGRNLSLGNAERFGANQSDYSRLDYVRNQLKQYAEDIHTPRMPLGQSLYQVYGLIASLQDLPEIALRLDEVASLTREQFDRLALLVADVENAQRNLGSKWYQNPWRDIISPRLNSSQKEALRISLRTAARTLDAVSAVRLEQRALTELLTLDALPACAELCECAAHVQQIPHDWFSAPLDYEERVLHALRDGQAEIMAARRELKERYGPDFLRLNGGSLRQKLRSALAALEKTLLGEEFDAVWYPELSDRLREVAHLREMWTVLEDALSVARNALELDVPDNVDMLENLVSLCAMALEARPLTRNYFSDLPALRLEATALREADNEQRTCREMLLSRFDASLLESEEISDWLSRYGTAKNQLAGIPLSASGHYDILHGMAVEELAEAAFRLSQAAKDTAVTEAGERYGVRFPATLAEIRRQVEALSTLDAIDAPPAWLSSNGRERAGRLLKEAAEHSETLRAGQRKLAAFFRAHGMTLNPNALTVADVSLLRKLSLPLPEARRIVNACADPTAFQSLRNIEENCAWFAEVQQKIAQLRTQYAMRPDWDGRRLVSFFLECGEAGMDSAPLSIWAEHAKDALSALEQLRQSAAHMFSAYQKITAEYDPAALQLDWRSMRERFQTQYIGLFRGWKRGYREDVKRIRELRKGKKPKDAEIMQLFENLQAYWEASAAYQSLSDDAERLLGVARYDERYDWQSVQDRLRAFETLYKAFENPAAAYRFITSVSREDWMGLMSYYDGLSSWFSGNAQGRERFGSLYRGAETDTEEICACLERAKDLLDCFASPRDLLVALEANVTERESAVQQAETVTDALSWFVSREAELLELTGVSGSAELWEERLRNWERYEALVKAFGDGAAWELAQDNRRGVRMDRAYVHALQLGLQLEKLCKTAFRTDRLPDFLSRTEISDLSAVLQNIREGARTMAAAFDFLDAFACVSVKEATVAEIGDALDAAGRYQADTARLSDSGPAQRFGPVWRRTETDWTRLENNLDFCETVRRLSGGTPTAQIVAMFIDSRPVWSAAQIAELQTALSNAKKLEQPYGRIAACPSLPEKLSLLDEASAALGQAVDVQSAVNAAVRAVYGYEETTNALNALTSLQETVGRYQEHLAYAQQRMPFWNPAPDTDWNKPLETLNWVRRTRELSDSAPPELARGLTNGLPDTPSAKICQAVGKPDRDAIRKITALFSTQDRMNAQTLDKLRTRLQNCADQFSTIDSWMDLRDAQSACREAGLGKFLLAAEDAYYPEGRLADVFRKSFYIAWLEEVMNSVSSVESFQVRAQEQRVSDFRKLEADCLRENQRRIQRKLISRIPSMETDMGEAPILRKEMNKRRNVMPLRKLFRAIPNLLLRLKPCLMMSPLSVAYFLDAEAYQFDMVIFDEASQIFPQDAIGAILRGKQVIIAGDSKQLPPTNFFAASAIDQDSYDSEEDEEEGAVAYDSILEEADGRIPARPLLWHYRSRHEDLISFSNRRIYRDELITFPGNIRKAPDIGVEYFYVRNGVYENRRNVAEAKECVRLVEEHMRRFPKRSLGVIAFSGEQQAQIEEELQEFRTSRPEYEDFFREDREEPFFVKNLENVQGDERDTIIFSVCYGRNPNGKFYHGFGPLGRQGGERRLNVAITRAKYNVKLVGSILPEDIDLNRTHSEGGRMLREYIAFAKNAVLPQKAGRASPTADEDTFIQSVGRFLRIQGYQVREGIGASAYKIDLAVECPERPGYFLAGVECDGYAYREARTVRDRDLLRPTVLEGMGWNLFRVWSTEWTRNPQREQERLLDFLRQRRSLAESSNANPAEITIPATTDATSERNGATGGQANTAHRQETVTAPRCPMETPRAAEKQTPAPLSFPPYRKANLSRISALSGASREYAAVKAILEAEQPICQELLYRRLADALGYASVTERARREMDSVLNRMRDSLIARDDFFQLRNFQSLQVRSSKEGYPDRKISQIAIPEIALAMETVLRGTVGVKREELIDKTMRIFGFQRKTAALKERMNQAVTALEKEGKVKILSGDRIQLLEESV